MAQPTNIPTGTEALPETGPHVLQAVGSSMHLVKGRKGNALSGRAKREQESQRLLSRPTMSPDLKGNPNMAIEAEESARDWTCFELQQRVSQVATQASTALAIATRMKGQYMNARLTPQGGTQD
jgi:hypothetical protein